MKPLNTGAYAGAIIVGAGSGERMGNVRKAFLEIGGRPLIERSAEKIAASENVRDIVLVLHEDDLERAAELIGRFKIVAVVPGGKRRQDSVAAGLAALPECEVVLIHDAARPLVDPDVVTHVSCVARNHGAGLAACRVTDTLKRQAGTVTGETVDRKYLWAAQTPQGFQRDIYEELCARAEKDALNVTDDASVFEHYGNEVELVPSPSTNIKITTPEDLAMAEALVRFTEKPEMRVGTGYDVHVLEAGRKLVLGGVEVNSDRGAAAHSDGDVACHALMDALLGAAALGDIGQHFPDSDEQYRDACSLELLTRVREKLSAAGFRTRNADLTIYLESPRLGELKAEMAAKMAGALGLKSGAVSVKAGTAEGLGNIGRGEAVGCQAAVLIESF